MIDRRGLILQAVGCLLYRPAGAHSYRTGNILIGHPWALPTTTGEAQIFFSLLNNAEVADELIAARSPIGSLVEFRSNNRYDDPPLTSIRLDPGSSIAMRPSARHLRLVGLSRPLGRGDRFSLILDFLNAGELEIEVMVGPSPGE